MAGASRISGSARMLARIRASGGRARSRGFEKPRLRHVSTMAPTPFRVAFSPRGLHRNGVDVGRENRSPPQLRGGDGEDAGARPQIEDCPVPRRRHRVERKQAAARALVRSGAERPPRVEHDPDASRRRVPRHMASADEKPARRDRWSPAVRLGDPIHRGERRTSYPPSRGSRDNKKVLSEKCISLASRCMSAPESVAASVNTASWLPAYFSSANTSTMKTGWWACVGLPKNQPPKGSLLALPPVQRKHEVQVEARQVNIGRVHVGRMVMPGPVMTAGPVTPHVVLMPARALPVMSASVRPGPMTPVPAMVPTPVRAASMVSVPVMPAPVRSVSHDARACIARPVAAGLRVPSWVL